MKQEHSLEKLFPLYDKARADAKETKALQENLGEEIKKLLETKKLEEVDTDQFKCVYKFEKDKETEIFDQEKFAEKDPKKYKQYLDLTKEMAVITKKYTKKVAVKGARKLLITRKNESEE